MWWRGERRGDTHHVAFDQIEAKRDLFNWLVGTVDAFLAVGEDDIGLLVVACEGALGWFDVSGREDDARTIGGLTTMARPSWRMRRTRPGCAL